MPGMNRADCKATDPKPGAGRQNSQTAGSDNAHPGGTPPTLSQRFAPLAGSAGPGPGTDELMELLRGED